MALLAAAGRLAYSRGPATAGGVFASMVGSLAVGALVHPATASGAALGALFGALFGLLAGRRTRLVRAVLLGVAGVAGSIAAVINSLEPGCSAFPFPVRILSLVLVALPAAVTVLAAGVTGRLHPQSGLAVFGVLEIVAVLSTPFGVSLVGAPAPAWVIVCVSAAVLGAATGIAPDLVIGLTGFALAVASAIVAATVGGSCSGGAGEFTVLVGDVVVYGLVRLVTRKLLP